MYVKENGDIKQCLRKNLELKLEEGWKRWFGNGKQKVYDLWDYRKAKEFDYVRRYVQ